MGLRGPQATPVAERFAAKLKSVSNGCIEWTGQTNGVGYGQFRLSPAEGSKRVYAHRWSYERRFGPIPDGMQLDHLCRNRICVNPDHLEPVTLQENVLRGQSSPAVNARKVECLRKHQLSGPNLYIDPTTGYRRCRACARMRDANRKPRRRRTKGI